MIRIFPRKVYWQERNALCRQGRENASALARSITGEKTRHEINDGDFRACTLRSLVNGKLPEEEALKAEIKRNRDVSEVRKNPLGKAPTPVDEIDILEIRENPLGKKPPIEERPLEDEVFEKAADSRFEFGDDKTPTLRALESLYERKLHDRVYGNEEGLEPKDLVKEAPLGLGKEHGETSLTTTSGLTGLPVKALERIRNIGKNIIEGNYFKL